MRSLIQDLKYFADKRFSTLAGTLVYFLLMSVTPLMFWVTLLAGNVDISGIVSHEFFTAAEPVLNYVQESARNAAGSAGLILILTTMWSSTNFFYHLRRSGEIIFGGNFKKGGAKLRLFSLLAVLGIIVIIAIVAAVPVFSAVSLSVIMPKFLAEFISFTFLMLFAFAVAYLLNVFACPYRLKFRQAVAGVLLTVTLWIICAVGFAVYLKFANPQKLYGAIAAVIVFLLWCYLMVNSLVIGIIYNGRYAHLY